MILKDFSNIHWVTGPGPEYDKSGLLADPYNLGYCRDINNFMVCRVVTFLSFFSFGKYLITCLLFSLISYTGVWKLYRFFLRSIPPLTQATGHSYSIFTHFCFLEFRHFKRPFMHRCTTVG